jgi:hypothetical protein
VYGPITLALLKEDFMQHAMRQCALQHKIEWRSSANYIPAGAKYRSGKTGSKRMPNAVIEDKEQFKAFLSAQPLCKWSAQKQQEIAAGMSSPRVTSSIHHSPSKNDNADLAAALSSMA